MTTYPPPPYEGSPREQIKKLFEYLTNGAFPVKSVPMMPEAIARGKSFYSVYCTRISGFQDINLKHELTVNAMVKGDGKAEEKEVWLEAVRDLALIILQSSYVPEIQIVDATRVTFEDTYPGYEIKIEAYSENPYKQI